MKPAAFDYLRPDTLPEALEALASGDASIKILAGGQSLVPMMNMRLARPTQLIDINDLKELTTITPLNRTLRIGAMVRQAELERYVSTRPSWALLSAALSQVGHPQTRNRGTVGGSLVHADPSAELPLLLVTYGGRLLLTRQLGTRSVDVEDFFQFLFTTATGSDELLTAVEWAEPAPAAGMAFEEFARRAGDFAVVAAACLVEVDENRHCRAVRLGLGGAGPVPLLADTAQLVGCSLETRTIEEFAVSLAQSLDPPEDLAADGDFRRQLIRTLSSRVLHHATRQAMRHQKGGRTHG